MRSGVTHLLWGFNDSFTRDDANRNQGSRQFRYVDGLGSFIPGHRLYMSFGARTEADGLPAARATYSGGRFEGEIFSRSDPNFATGRSYIDGNLNLTADFENGAVEGRIDRIWVNPPGPDNHGFLPFSTRFDIEHGTIAGGQFTATLTGVDTNPDAATDRTIAGYKGAILGEFYGPYADEVGGVLNAESDAHDSVIGGWFGGRQLRSVVPAGQSSAPSSVGVERDFDASTVQVADDTGVTSIASDGAGGYSLTYRIDGVEHAIQLEGSDYGGFLPNPNFYFQRTGAEGYTLYSARSLFYGSTSVYGHSEFDHFDILGWAALRYASATSNTIESSPRGFLVHGVRTEAASLPTGEASYAGGMGGYIWEEDKPDTSDNTRVRGDLSLTADFDDDTVTGTIDGIETRPPGQTTYRSSTEVLTIGSGTITDSTFTATLTGAGGASSRYEGDVDGQFFGPDAREVGGVLQATHTGNDNILIGWIAGKRDDLAATAASQ